MLAYFISITIIIIIISACITRVDALSSDCFGVRTPIYTIVNIFIRKYLF